MNRLRIVGKALGWILVGLMILLSVFAFKGEYFSPITLGFDFLAMASLAAVNAATGFKKPLYRYRVYTIEYDNGATDCHVVREDRSWNISTAGGKSVRRISVREFESEAPNL